MSTLGELGGPDDGSQLERAKQRTQGFAEITSETSNITEYLKYSGRIDQIDWKFNFPYLPHSRIMLPDVVADKDVIDIDITTGEVNETDPTTKQQKRVASLSVEITTRDGIVRIHRTDAPEDINPDGPDPDTFFESDPTLNASDMDEAEIAERTHDIPRVSRAEVNALIMSLISNDPNSGYRAFADKNLLDHTVLPFLNETLRERALAVEIRGIHGFNNPHVEIEFGFIDSGEFFDITYPNQTTGKPMIAHGIGFMGFGILIESLETGLPQHRIPSVEDLDHLKNILKDELEHLKTTYPNEDSEGRTRRIASNLANAAFYEDPSEIALRNVEDRTDQGFWDRALADELNDQDDDSTEERP